MQAQAQYERQLDGRGAWRFVGLLVGGALTCGIVGAALAAMAMWG